MNYSQEISYAIEAVRNAGKLCQQVQGNLISSDSAEKTDRSPVTIADLGSQAVITLALWKAFPGEPLVGEEDSDPLRNNPPLKQKVHELVAKYARDVSDSLLFEAIDFGVKESSSPERFWTLDPIDGTKGFLRGDQYAIALALIENGEVVMGVLGCPNLPLDSRHPEKGAGCLFYAAKGEGSWMEPLDGGEKQRVTVDGIGDPSQARFCESVEAAHASHDVHAEISRLMGITQPPFRIDSQCKYASVARGDASIYFRLPRSSDYREKIRDHAAGAIIVSEAGGRVSDFSGNPLNFSRGRKLEDNVGLIATNGTLHDKALQAISRVVTID